MQKNDHTETFRAMLAESLRDGTFVKATLGKYRGAEPDLQSVSLRLVAIKGEDRLAFLFRYRTRDISAHHGLEDGLAVVRELLGASFLSGHLFATSGDAQIEYSRKRKPHLSVSRPTCTDIPSKSHDREKQRPIVAAGSGYLQALGVLDGAGEVREKMGGKFRQINRFIEIVAGLFDSSELAGRQEITVVDMGSGKGYLTFALYDYLNNVRGIRANVLGVEVRPELVKLCAEIARESGFERLEFREAYIGDYQPDGADILIALHACNTATDDAIHKGIAAGAAIIICAPCCHKEIRRQIVPPPALRGILRHGILLEREAECLTDALRALLLEHSGYDAKVFEFISTEHTRKNTMIVGLRGGTPDREKALGEIGALKAFYGIREQRLEKLLGLGM